MDGVEQMKNFAQFAAEDRRFTILSLLFNSPAYTASQYVLHTAMPRFGHYVGMDQLKGDMQWLDEQGLIEKRVVDEVWIPRLTTRGADVVEARLEHPGVKRPLPE
jgi:hypothetical protein